MCTNKGGTWSLTKNATGEYTFTLDTYGKRNTGTKVFSKKSDQFFTTDNGAFSWEFLNVSKKFDVEYDK